MPVRVSEISLSTIVVRVEEPTVSIPSHLARRTTLPITAASTPPVQMPPSSVPHPRVRYFADVQQASREGLRMSLTTLSSTRPWRSAAGRPCSCCCRRIPKARNPVADRRSITGFVGAEGDDTGLGRAASFDARVLNRDVRVGAPGVDAVGSHAPQVQALEADIPRPVEDRDADTPLAVAGDRAAAVEGQVGDADVPAFGDEQRPVAAPRRSMEHRLRA